MLAFDVDHFKQVNDTYGHLYGDIVLRTIAWRLEDQAARICTANKQLGISIGRPSGEEFLALVLGTRDYDQLIDVAEQFRKSLGGSVLPTQEEWDTLASTVSSTVVLPHAAERIVTVSVGISVVTPDPAGLGIDDNEIAIRLKDEADTALYRAKAGGRMPVRAFRDIMAR